MIGETTEICQQELMLTRAGGGGGGWRVVGRLGQNRLGKATGTCPGVIFHGVAVLAGSHSERQLGPVRTLLPTRLRGISGWSLARPKRGASGNRLRLDGRIRRGGRNRDDGVPWDRASGRLRGQTEVEEAPGIWRSLRAGFRKRRALWGPCLDQGDHRDRGAIAVWSRAPGWRGGWGLAWRP